ncbi:calpain-2 catalytic subunit-like isoform X1 [Biomphalaria glabrata]|uniref:Calpain-2 catalytic subunit-like isoform X1 n=1 Tax=Biomphalaria glabrata TaxID=6526 RepID=A0A9W3A0J5_BIOGL|nr:calpain-2 catalytic subunit-like isoform X1 [Biomphalaria glabrata]
MGCGSSLHSPQNSDKKNGTDSSPPQDAPVNSPVSVMKDSAEEDIVTNVKKEKRKKTSEQEGNAVHPGNEKQTGESSKPERGKEEKKVEPPGGVSNAQSQRPVSKKDLYYCDPATGCCVLRSKLPQSPTNEEASQTKTHVNDHEQKKGPRDVQPLDSAQQARHLPRKEPTVPTQDNVAPGNDARRHTLPETNQHASPQPSPLAPHRGISCLPVRLKNAATAQATADSLHSLQRTPGHENSITGPGKDIRQKQDISPGRDTRLRQDKISGHDTRNRQETGLKESVYNKDKSEYQDVRQNKDKLSGNKDNRPIQHNLPPPDMSTGLQTKITGDNHLHIKEADKNKRQYDEKTNTKYQYQGGFQRNSECYTESSVFTDKMLGMSFDQEFNEFVNSIPPGYLFEDLDFPADVNSLFFKPVLPSGNLIQWMRPYQLVEDGTVPELVSYSVSSNDIMQGILGDCWFLSCCAAISKKKRLVNKVVPKNQVLYGPSYRGVVRFRFWRFGNWIQVLIDDRLPVVNGKLIYGRCTSPTEFWVALIEKAYAKLHGCYEALGGGITKDAFVDLTGGVAERYELNEYSPMIYKLIYRANKAGGFVACSRKGDWRLSNVADANGLVPGHAYTITDAVMLAHKMGYEKLLCIKNPWGDGTKWKGSWNEKDANWQWVEEDLRERMLNLREIGEFWMSYRDFLRQFGEVTICHLTPDLDGDGEPDEIGHMEIIKGEWVLGKTAGGSRNNLVKFITNDQYLLTILESDSFNIEVDDAESEGKCNIVIALMQEHRQTSHNVKVSSYQIGFFIYESSERIYKLPLQFFRYNPDFAKTNTFINYREVSGRFELYPGHYVIIPTTFLEDCPAHFMLRVFGEKKFLLRGPLLNR